MLVQFYFNISNWYDILKVYTMVEDFYLLVMCIIIINVQMISTILFKDEYKFNFKEEENKLYFQINIKLILKCNCIGYIITKEK